MVVAMAGTILPAMRFVLSRSATGMAYMAALKFYARMSHCEEELATM